MIINLNKTKYMPAGTYHLDVSRYAADEAPALQLYDAETGEPMMRPTVCLVDARCTPEFPRAFIKDWSENEGILAALTEAGIVLPTGRVVLINRVTAHEVTLSNAVLTELEAFDKARRARS